MINIPDTLMTTDGYTPHKFINGFVKDWEELRSEWPPESLFKKEGHQTPRKHGQRQHIRLFFCYTPWEDSKLFDQEKVRLDLKLLYSNNERHQEIVDRKIENNQSLPSYYLSIESKS